LILSKPDEAIPKLRGRAL